MAKSCKDDDEPPTTTSATPPLGGGDQHQAIEKCSSDVAETTNTDLMITYDEHIKMHKFTKKRRDPLSSRSSGGRSLKSFNSTTRDSTDITAISLSTTNGNSYASAGGYSNSCFGSINQQQSSYGNNNTTNQFDVEEEDIQNRRNSNNSSHNYKTNNNNNQEGFENSCNSNPSDQSNLDDDEDASKQHITRAIPSLVSGSKEEISKHQINDDDSITTNACIDYEIKENSYKVVGNSFDDNNHDGLLTITKGNDFDNTLESENKQHKKHHSYDGTNEKDKERQEVEEEEGKTESDYNADNLDDDDDVENYNEDDNLLFGSRDNIPKENEKEELELFPLKVGRNRSKSDTTNKIINFNSNVVL